MSGSAALQTHAGNSIDFLRLLLAVAVACGHCYPIGGFPPQLTGILFGVPMYPRLAVAGFFFLSGFLIARSYLESSSVARYLWKRALRIFPAFWVCLIVTAFLLVPLMAWGEQRGLLDYFRPGAESPFRYVRVNALLWIGQYSIHDLPRHVPYPRVVNGSLWTLFTEFQCYLAVIVLGAMGVLGRRTALVGVVALLLLMQASAFVRHLPLVSPFYRYVLFRDPLRLEQWLYFMIGCCAYQFRRRLVLDGRLFALALPFPFFTTIGALGVPAPPIIVLRLMAELQCFALSYALFWLAFCLPLKGFGRRGDFSYGFYVYAFPIQQLLAVFGLNRFGFLPYFVFTVVGTLPWAVGSWFLVERPCLELKSWRSASLARTKPRGDARFPAGT